MRDFWKSWIFWVVVAIVVLAATGTILYYTVPAFQSVVLKTAAGLLVGIIGFLVGRYFANRP